MLSSRSGATRIIIHVSEPGIDVRDTFLRVGPTNLGKMQLVVQVTPRATRDASRSVHGLFAESDQMSTVRALGGAVHDNIIAVVWSL